MPSNYQGFEVGYDKEDGTAPVKFASQVVKVRNVTGGADLPDLTADANGTIASGTLSVAVGTTIRFYFQVTTGTYKGVSGFKEIITT